MVAIYDIGTRCWIPDDQEGWIGAEITEKDIDDTTVTFQLSLENGQTHTVKTTVHDLENDSDSLPPLRNPPVLETTEDLTSLSYLNEPAVLHAIKMRYGQLNIYTYSGIVLIATNPFQRIDNLYTPDIIQAYSGTRRGELEPHLFAIAEDAYRCMLRDEKNQTIVVSGESGAGKTVSAKYIMRYFATVDAPDRPRRSKSTAGNAMSKTEEQILATNPIMEAFGNAKTTRNDNSSRFGKYLEILFNKDIDIIGAKIRTYLLERSRLVFQPANERNYHIFYQLCKGASDQEKDIMGLAPVSDFNYLNQGGDSEISNVDDGSDFQDTREALNTIGISSETQLEIFKILAALLHIGNIEITPTRSNAVLNSDEPSLIKACELLGLDPIIFAKWTIKKQISTRSEKIISNLNHKQAVVVRDSVAKFIYSSLFDWLVRTINGGLCDEAIEHQINSFIGVLDIYGFEHFQHNSFEQFCINYANEKLQQEFNQHVFKLEQDEYISEEINWTFIDFSDNQPCITLIEAKLGILSLLDEESRLPAGSDEGWIQKLYQNFDKDTHNKFFKKPRFGNKAFIVNHYAMEVTYEVEGFIEKNRDTVPDEHMEVLNATTNPFLKDVITPQQPVEPVAPIAKTGPRTVNRKPTLGGIFKSSLIELMGTINSTNVHYIRCIKPNDDKAAWQFNGPMVLSQLRACGVLETIRISCDGFPTRWTYEEFASRYYMLVPSNAWTSGLKDLCNSILEKSFKEDGKYQLGKTKIFFRAGMLAYLEKLRSDRLNDCATIIQKNLRMVYYRNRYQEIRQSIIALQTVVRAHITKKRVEAERREKASVVIQKNWRGFAQRQSYTKTRNSIIDLQRSIRGWLLRQQLMQARSEAAAITIQSSWRGYAAKKDYNSTRKKIIIVQGLVRQRQAKKQLQQLRVEAKSVNHFKEVQYRLENKVVELTQNLETRREENKKLLVSLDSLTLQLSQSQKKHSTSEERVIELEKQTYDLGTAHKTELETVQALLADKEKEYEGSLSKIAELSEENKSLSSALELKDEAIKKAGDTIQQFQSKEASLTETIVQLRKDLEDAEKASVAAVAVGSAATLAPLRSVGINGSGTPSTKRRNPKRQSLTTAALAGIGGDRDGVNYSPRPASVLFPPQYKSADLDGDNGRESLDYKRASDSSDLSEVINRYNTQIMSLFEDETTLHDEVFKGLIKNLKIPVPTSSEKITMKEVLFPANIINMTISEMWRLGYFFESERLLGSIMQGIQSTVMSLKGEDIINPGAFWISNVHEILSFIYLAESNIINDVSITAQMGEYEFQEYGRLLTVAKQDLESLEFNIYHSWMKELKKLLDRMIVPAVVMSQSLPGFMTVENTRFLAKMFTSNTVEATMDDLLSLFNKVHKAMEAYYLEEEFMKQPIMELLKLVGAKAFNDMLMRRNFLSWKRGLQINYNVTRIEEWCKSHNVAEGILRLEHVVESVKLLQLKKASIDDIEIIFDICWALTPQQIHKLISQYYTADYEPPISAHILEAVAAQVKKDSGNQVLLIEVTGIDDSGPFEIMDPRPLNKIESYIPGWVPVPTLKRLSELTTQVNLLSSQGPEDLKAFDPEAGLNNGGSDTGLDDDDKHLESVETRRVPEPINV